jgi:hypothetical protein
MATKHNDDDFDFPDRPVEPDPSPKVIVQAEDLHLGAATVRPVGRSWAEQHGPQPPGIGLQNFGFLNHCHVCWICVVVHQSMHLGVVQLGKIALARFRG